MDIYTHLCHYDNIEDKTIVNYLKLKIVIAAFGDHHEQIYIIVKKKKRIKQNKNLNFVTFFLIFNFFCCTQHFFQFHC